METGYVCVACVGESGYRGVCVRCDRRKNKDGSLFEWAAVFGRCGVGGWAPRAPCRCSFVSLYGGLMDSQTKKTKLGNRKREKMKLGSDTATCTLGCYTRPCISALSPCGYECELMGE